MSSGKSLFRSLFWRVLPVLLLAGVHLLAASPDPPQFEQANRLYEQGKFQEAVQAYQSLLRDGRASAAVYFNLGNAHYRLGQIGQAIAAYRLAERLNPRDPDIRANLGFARANVPGGTPNSRLYQRWLNRATPDELSWATMIAVWVCLLAAAAGQIRPTVARAIRPYILLGAAIAVLLAIWLGALVRYRLGAPGAVVVQNSAVVRYGPFEESQSAFPLKDGAEVSVLDEKNGWVYVRASGNRLGWLRQIDLQLLPRG